MNDAQKLTLAREALAHVVWAYGDPCARLDVYMEKLIKGKIGDGACDLIRAVENARVALEKTEPEKIQSEPCPHCNDGWICAFCGKKECTDTGHQRKCTTCDGAGKK